MKKCYLIDLDGTMYRGTERIEGAKEWLDSLIENKIPFLFLTNNSARTPRQIIDHMEKMGFEHLLPEHCYTSAMAASDTMASGSEKRRAFMIGEEGLKEALLNNHFELVDSQADFVFIGLNRQGTYQDYSLALRQVMQGAVLVGTNNDRILLSEAGVNCGNGSIVAMMEYASGKAAVKIGKPHPAIIEGALKAAGVTKEQAVIVGDNLETDILSGVHMGIETVFVTTGVHTKEEADAYDIHPTHIIENLKELM